MKRSAEKSAADAPDDWAAALAAEKQAAALMESETADTELRRIVEQLRTEMQAHEADREMLARLASAETAGSEVNSAGNHFMTYLQRPAYGADFREFGIDCDSMPVDEAGARILRRPVDVQAALIAGLDQWNDLELRFATKSAEDRRSAAPLEPADQLPTTLR